MSQYDNTNRGVLFENNRKESDSHPDLTGTININGVEHWFSGWRKSSRNGEEFISVSIGKEKESRPIQKPRPVPEPVRQASGFDGMDSDVPF